MYTSDALLDTYRKDSCVSRTCVLAAPPTFKHNFAKKIRNPKSTLVIEKKLVVCSLILTKNLTKSNVA